MAGRLSVVEDLAVAVAEAAILAAEGLADLVVEILGAGEPAEAGEGTGSNSLSFR